MAMKSSEQQSIENTEGFFRILGAFENLPETVEKKGSYTDLIRCNLKVQRVDAGRVTCILIVGPAILNLYGTLHGGAVTAVAEEVTLACVRTVVGDKRFFLGEASTSYLSSASLNINFLSACRGMTQHNEANLAFIHSSITANAQNITLLCLVFGLRQKWKLMGA